MLVALLVSYVVSLSASHFVRSTDGGSPAEDPTAATVDLTVPSDDDRQVSVAYRTWGDWSDLRSPVIVLLHGSPGSSRNFQRLAPALAERYRVLAPDLPGFGGSEKRVPDYSIDAHADYTAELLEHLGIDRAHVVGYSMGGGVALELASDHPESVRSLTLLSSIGAQEFELLGNYFLNHAVHGIQLVGLWFLHEAIPHFGRLDSFPLDVPYARNFYDTDQRPLRQVLERLDMPVLIVHGEQDFLVPPEAGREHYRLTPHSELVMLDAGHGMVFRATPTLSEPIADFVARVERGVARRRGDADPVRIARANEPFDPTSVPPAVGLSLLLLMTLIGLATLVSEDATSIATGLLISQGRIGFVAGAVACGVGILVGDMLIYAAGRFIGRPALDRRPLKWLVSPRALARSSAWFERRGPAVVFTSRFLPGTRVPVCFSAGLLGARFWRFLGYFLLAVVVWTPFIVGLSAVLGDRLFAYFDAFERWALPGAAAIAVLLWVAVVVARRLSTWRGRRLLFGAVRRKLEWEFWPWWIVYLPVYPWIVWLGLRYRSLTLFTAANPGIEAGGFVGESKAAILASIDPARVARFQKVDAGLAAADRLAHATAFLELHSLDYPVVVKPDVGERGSGFTIVNSAETLHEVVSRTTHDFLIQEYVGGAELGIFYTRLPGEDRGEIFSITEKRLLHLVGDGRSTIEELILRDERAVRMAPIHLDRMARQLDRVPESDSDVPLVELGVHSRGALFLDGSRFATPELENAVDEISRSFDGFFFGRYDMRAPSYEHFRRGEEIKVLELNGVTSEATHIYDPQNSWFDASRVLRRQWALAFEIGALNRQRGVRPTRVRELLRLAYRHVLRR